MVREVCHKCALGIRVGGEVVNMIIINITCIYLKFQENKHAHARVQMNT